MIKNIYLSNKTLSHSLYFSLFLSLSLFPSLPFPPLFPNSSFHRIVIEAKKVAIKKRRYKSQWMSMEIVGVRKQHRLYKQNCLSVNAIIVSYFLSVVSRMIQCLILTTLTNNKCFTLKTQCFLRKSLKDLFMIVPFKKNEKYYLKESFDFAFFG